MLVDGALCFLFIELDTFLNMYSYEIKFKLKNCNRCSKFFMKYLPDGTNPVKITYTRNILVSIRPYLTPKNMKK